MSPDFDKNRSIRADRLFFNADGTIRKVVPTLRGVGLVGAKSRIQLDRYSATSGEGVAVAFLNAADLHAGWKISLVGKSVWTRFNDVDFGQGGLKRVNLRAVSAKGGAIEIHLDQVDGPLLGRIKIKKGPEWQVFGAKAQDFPTGVHDLVITSTRSDPVDLDWITFE